MKMSAIERELLAATKVKRNDGETDQKYMGRVVEAVDNLPDPDFEKLSKDTQAWVNKAITAKEGSKEIPGFEPGAAKAPAKKEAAKAPAKKEAAKAPAKKEAATGKGDKAGDEPEPIKKSMKKAAPKKPAKEPKPKKNILAKFRRLVIKNPTWNRQRVMAECEKRGHPIQPGAAATTFYNTHATLEMLRDMEIID